jgi:aminopeptidase-like protein
MMPGNRWRGANLPSAHEIEDIFDRLWPIMRSLTGDGVRRTLDILSEIVPISRIEIPSGTQAFDWRVPQEWNFNEAYIIDPLGRRILDAAENTLHLVNYSIPFSGRMGLKELQNHLFSLPERPEAIPYVTSYYAPRWGFCLSQIMRDQLTDGEYAVVVDTTLKDGTLTLGEVILPGEEEREILFSSYVCHPSLANNELSGPIVAAYLCRALSKVQSRRLTYRFVFLVETIGAISYLARHGEHLQRNLHAGYVVTCTGTSAPYVYKRSRRGDTVADRAALYVLGQSAPDYHAAIDFDPADGSDERQYCSPGFDLPVGSLMRTRYNTYPEYHTSNDNKSFVSFDAMRETIGVYCELCQTLEQNVIYENTIKFGEPQLGRRGLYGSLGGAFGPEASHAALLWLLNLADGTRDLLAIAERSKVDIKLLAEVSQRACGAGIVTRCQ